MSNRANKETNIWNAAILFFAAITAMANIISLGNGIYFPKELGVPIMAICEFFSLIIVIGFIRSQKYD